MKFLSHSPLLRGNLPQLIEAIFSSTLWSWQKYLSDIACYEGELWWHLNCLKTYTVSDILLCTQSPLLIKGLYGNLRDEGYHVDLSDYPAQAVQQIMKNPYEAIIIDSQAFGLPAEDAVKIIKTIAPDVRVILVGYPEDETDSLSIKVPVDLEKLRDLVHGACIQAALLSIYKEESSVWQ